METQETKTAKFGLGQTVITAGAMNEIDSADVVKAITRHVTGDWGDLEDEDKEQNEAAVRDGDNRIFSAYHDRNGTKFWIITEYDRSVTTVLLPAEY